MKYELTETGCCAAASIIEMVAALECDYERLEELRQQKTDSKLKASRCIEYSASAELADLEEAAGECTSREEAETRIQEDALSVEVRSGWVDVAAYVNLDQPAEEFYILLSTGGPASRIRGELDNGEPVRAWLEVQDWGTPWTQVFGGGELTEACLAYARCFYFGEG